MSLLIGHSGWFILNSPFRFTSRLNCINYHNDSWYSRRFKFARMHHAVLCHKLFLKFFCLVFPPVKLIVCELHPQLSVFQEAKCWIKQSTAWLVTCQRSWTIFGNIWMVGVDFPPCLSHCRQKPVHTGTGPNEAHKSRGLYFLYTSHSHLCCKIWLIACISAGEKIDERISCANSADDTKSLPKVFIKASPCEKSKWKTDPNDIKAHLGVKCYNNKYINNGEKSVVDAFLKNKNCCNETQLENI